MAKCILATYLYPEFKNTTAMRNTSTFRSALLTLAIVLFSTTLFAMNNATADHNDKQHPQKVDLQISSCDDQSILSLSTTDPIVDATIKILDFKGKEVKSDIKSIGNKKNIITLSEFDTGLYFIDIKALNVNITLPVILK